MSEDFIRVQEFVAHATQVNCVAIGAKSTQVLATGGEDMKVNIWRVGSVSNIWTLGQNKSPIECLCFDSDEYCVVSGAYNGSLKVFDLNEGKLARNLGSHQVNVTSVQYHPYGEFLVSGSSDCTMKFWDVRNKTCVETYTGHKKELTCVRFSPDGKWVASAAKDGTILFFDLIASKHIDTIRIPSPGYIQSFEFNPTEFSLAAATNNRVIRIWDLETMKPTAQMPPEPSSVKAFAYSNLGNTLYSSSKNNLKIWDTESIAPGAQHPKLVDTIDNIGWNESIADMKVINNDQVVAASFVSNFVSVWEVDLSYYSQERPEEKEDVEETSSKKANNVFASPKAAARDRNSQEKATPDHKSVVSSSASEKETVPSRVVSGRYDRVEDDADDFYAAAPAKAASAHTAASKASPSYESIDSKYYEFDEKAVPEVIHSSPNGTSQDMAASMGESFWKKFQKENPEEGHYPLDFDEEENDDDSVVGGNRKLDVIEENIIPMDELEDMLPPSSYGVRAAAAAPSSIKNVNNNNADNAGNAAKVKNNVPITVMSKPVPSSPLVSKAPAAGFRSNAAGQGRPVSTNLESGLEVVGNNRLPSAAGVRPSTSSSAASNAVTDVQQTRDIMEKLLQQSPVLIANLSQRMSTLKILHHCWNRGSIQDVLEQLRSICDTAVLFHSNSSGPKSTISANNMSNFNNNVTILTDFFLGVELKGHGLTLDSCVKLVAILEDMLQISNGANSPSAAKSSSGQHSPTMMEIIVQAVYKAMTELTLAFGDLIRSTRSVGSHHNVVVSNGVDLSREARLAKCNACHDVFYRARQRLETLRTTCRSNANTLDVLDVYARLAVSYYSN